jgi:hypothetical protein
MANRRQSLLEVITDISTIPTESTSTEDDEDQAPVQLLNAKPRRVGSQPVDLKNLVRVRRSIISNAKE